LANKRRPDALVSFIRLSKGYYRCDRLSSSRRRLLNLPDTRPTTPTLAERRAERWTGAYRSSSKPTHTKIEHTSLG